jgi:(S)-mandelate dehydrogenase
VLPEIKKAINGQLPIFADSGFSRGSDVVKALALGADAVCVGKALIMGLAAGESEGVREMVEILTEEVRRIMSVTGCPDLSAIDENILIRRNLFAQEN